MYYKCHLINQILSGSYTYYPDWIKNKKATINPINKKDNKCFQYGVTVTFGHEEIGKNPDRIANIKPFTNKYKWEGIDFPSKKDDWNKIEKNNVTVAFIVLYANIEKANIVLIFQNITQIVKNKLHL